MTRRVGLFVAVVLGCLGCAGAQSVTDAAAPLVVPQDTTLTLELRSIVNSRTAWVGEAVACVTVEPVVVDQQIVIPPGSFVRGHVTRVERPRRVRGRSQLALRFDSVVLPSGLTRPIVAAVTGLATTGPESYSAQKEAIVGPGTRGRDLAAVALTAGQWATVGSLAAVNFGESAQWGGGLAAAGGVVRLVDALVSRADAIVLMPGANLAITLEAPLIFPAHASGPVSAGSELAHMTAPQP